MTLIPKWIGLTQHVIASAMHKITDGTNICFGQVLYSQTPILEGGKVEYIEMHGEVRVGHEKYDFKIYICVDTGRCEVAEDPKAPITLTVDRAPFVITLAHNTDPSDYPEVDTVKPAG